MTGTVVLMYHRVVEVAADPYAIAVLPGRFEQQLAALAARWEVVPLAACRERRRRPAVALTFDDGYRDNADTAAPVLAAAGLPATFFVTTGHVLRPAVLWWERLAAALLADGWAGWLRVGVEGRPLWLDVDCRAARERSLAFLHRRLRPLAPEVADAVVDAVVAAAPEHADCAPAGMTPQQVRGLTAAGFEVGAHTRTHSQLGGRPVHAQRDEVFGSFADLAGMGAPVRRFAYPFGTRSAVGDLAPALVEEAGGVLAVITEPGVAGPRSHPLRVPRVAVEDWPADRLVARVEQVLSA